MSGTFGATKPFGEVATVSIFGGTLLFRNDAAPIEAQSSSSVSECFSVGLTGCCFFLLFACDEESRGGTCGMDWYESLGDDVGTQW